MTPETRVVLANCAGSFLILVAFVFLILVSALLLLFVRGLWLARHASPEQLARLHAMADRARQQTTDTATSVIDPQIQLASAWAGLKAGVRVFVGRGASAGPAEARLPATPAEAPMPTEAPRRDPTVEPSDTVSAGDESESA